MGNAEISGHASSGIRLSHGVADTRAAIVAAALKTFAAYGFDGATTRQIAAAAGIEQGHLTYYFTSKLRLWTAVVEEYSQDLLAMLRRELAGDALDDPVASARRVLPRFLRHLSDNRLHARIMQQEFALSSPRHDWVVTRFGGEAWHILQPLFHRLHDEGRLRGGAPISSYFTVVGSALVVFGSAGEIAMIAGIDPASEDFVEQHIAMLMSVLLT